jgi:alpha-1,3-rhamnosyl/mannosyltransferase
MRIVVNQLASLKRKAGVGHYAAELVGALRAADAGEVILTYPEGWVRRGCERFYDCGTADHVGVSRSGNSREAFRRFARTSGRLAVGWHFRRFLKNARIQLYHEPNFIPLACDCPTVATIHDLSVLRHPEWHPADRVRHFEKEFGPRLRECAHVLTVSDAMREEVIAELGLSPDRVSRAHHGVRANLRPAAPVEIAHVRQKHGLPPQYLLHLGTVEPRKNLLMLMRAYCQLPDVVRERCGLVLAGSWGWNSTATASFFDHTARSCGVQHLGYVPEEDLAALYTGASALVFPTHYEGFGFPALEMMACGGAVIASTDPAVMEVTGQRAFHIHPEDEDGWRLAMQRVIEDHDWRQQLRRGVREQARQFTWERCAIETMQAYHRALGLTERVELPALAA